MSNYFNGSLQYFTFYFFIWVIGTNDIDWLVCMRLVLSIAKGFQNIWPLTINCSLTLMPFFCLFGGVLKHIKFHIMYIYVLVLQYFSSLMRVWLTAGLWVPRTFHYSQCCYYVRNCTGRCKLFHIYTGALLSCDGDNRFRSWISF